MKKLCYREKLALDLMDDGICRSSTGVYLAGTNDKKPSKYARLRISLYGRTKHPENKWGLEIKPFLAEKKLSEKQSKKAKK
ncbi:hypothetical protein [Campylobacter californiensis]|uniref:hypothetical protein n=1 Tax=Campylobacter californiensis TaxID=1032243 RepID=UPI00147348D1|nr:hypothetical protein [Campylobacter sp. RM12916]MBE3610506.1 hypothetical protein [Campylobacter sp. RM12916]